HSPCSFVAGFVQRRRQRQQRRAVLLESFSDCLLLASQPLLASLPALFQQVCVQLVPTRASRHRNQEVASRVADQPLDFSLVISLAGPPEPLLEQVVTLQLRKRLRLLSR